MRTITTKVYKFNELSDEAKEQATEAWRDGMDYPYLEEAMQDQLEYLLEKYKVTPIDVQVRYSLGYSQGDGASFTGEVEFGAYRATISTNYYGNWYSHSKSVSVSEMTSKKTDKEAPDATYAKLEKIVETIGDELEKFGYEEIEYEQSDDVIAELLLANDYEFNEDGEMI